MSILIMVRHRQEAETQAKIMAQLARETDNTPIRVTSATPAGDSARLRGIPAIGRGVAGAINGTKPDNIRG